MGSRGALVSCNMPTHEGMHNVLSTGQGLCTRYCKSHLYTNKLSTLKISKLPPTALQSFVLPLCLIQLLWMVVFLQPQVQVLNMSADFLSSLLTESAGVSFQHAILFTHNT